MTTLALLAWTDHPSRIPTKKTVYITEPETPIIHFDGLTQYDMLIHLRSAVDSKDREMCNKVN